MKTRFFTTAIALMALTFVFNSCEKEDDEPTFPVDIELLMEDGEAVGTIVCTKDLYKVNGNIGGRFIKVHFGTDKEKLISEMADTTYLTPNKQYFWQVEVRDMSKDKYYYSDVRSLYSLGSIEFTTDNGENEIAAVVRWTNDSKYKNYKVTMTPTKECGFAGMTFDIPEGQDSLYIKWLDNTSIPYMFNDFDDLHGINYEPVVYNFKLTADVTIGDKTFQTFSNSVKEIFLNKKNHVRDHELNVYRIVTIGDQIWLADDLRCTSYINSKGDTVQMKLNKDYIVSELPSGAKGILYNHDFLFDWGTPKQAHINGLVPPGFHYAVDADWTKLEKVYGIDANNPKYCETMYKYGICTENEAFPVTGSLYYELLKDKADSLYANSTYVDLWELFASASDWVDENGNQAYPSSSVFNIKPFGYGYRSGVLYNQGYGALYYSHLTRIRTFFSMKHGIGHYEFGAIMIQQDSYGVCYAVRLVKDI